MTVATRESLLVEVAQLREEVAALQAEIRALRGAANDLANLLPVAWKLSRTEARIIASLYSAGGCVVTREQLMDNLYWDRAGDEPEPKIIDVYKVKIKRKVPPEVEIITHWGRGWSLSKDAIAYISAQLKAESERVAEELSILRKLREWNTPDAPPLVPEQEENHD